MNSSLPRTMLKISKSLAELLGFEWTKRPKFKDMLAKPDSGKPLFHDYSGNCYHHDQFFEMSPLQDTYYMSDNICDLLKGLYSRFVYYDIVENVVVGDVQAPLLQTIKINGKDNKMISRIYQTVWYVSVQHRQFDMIKIDIRNDIGRCVPFLRGKEIVTPHFRLKKPSNF